MCVHIRIRGGKFVTVYPPGEARGAHDLRTRGLPLGYDPTCWPRHKFATYRLTTGGEPRHFVDPVMNGYMDLLLAVFVPEKYSPQWAPNKNDWDKEAWAWILRWRKEAHELAQRRSS